MIGGIATWVAVGSTSIRRVTSGAPAMELLAGHQPIPLPPPASPVNYRRVLRAVHATVDPLAAALVVASAAPVRITLFADVSVLAEHEYREPSLDQDDRIRWSGTMSPTAATARSCWTSPPRWPTRRALLCTGPSSWRTGCSESIRPATLQPDASAGAVIVRKYELHPQPR